MVTPPGTKPRSRYLRTIVRILVGLVLLVCSLAVYLQIFGLPRIVRDAVIRELNKKGVFVDAAAIYLNFPKGVVFEDVSYYLPDDRITPILKADTVELRPIFDDVGRALEVRINDGAVRMELAALVNDPRNSTVLNGSNISLNLVVSEDALDVKNVSIDFPNLELRLRGEVSHWLSDEVVYMVKEDLLVSVSKPHPVRSEAGRIIRSIVKELDLLTMDTPLRMDVDFAVNKIKPSEAEVKVVLASRSSIRGRGGVYDYAGARVTFSDMVLDIPQFRMTAGDRSLDIVGKVDFGNEIWELDIENSLPIEYVDRLLPLMVVRALEDRKLRFEGDVRTSLKVGPMTFTKPSLLLVGKFDVENGYYEDTLFPQVSLELIYKDGDLSLNNIRGEVGSGKGQGPVKGDIFLGLRSRRYDIDVKGGFDPSEVASLTLENVEKAIREFEFPDLPPEISVKVTYRALPEKHLVADVQFNSTDVIVKGSSLEALSFRYQRETGGPILVQPIKASRGDDEELVGNVVINPEKTKLELDLVSSIHPPAVAIVIGPHAVELLSPFQFKGGTEIALKGSIGLDEDRAHNLEGDFKLNTAGYFWLIMEKLEGSFALQRDILTIPDLRAESLNGRLVASLVLKGLRDSEKTEFSTVVKGYDIDLYEMLNASMDKTTNPYSGLLNFEIEAAGPWFDQEGGAGRNDIKGKGKIRIREGALFKMPIFLGLSRILSKVIKGIGYSSISAFSCDFNIANGRINSDNLFLRGDVLSIKGKGFLGFNNKMKANLQIQVLNEGVLADALNLLLWPISKLIEIQLQGTWSDPTWQPRNLPRELFGK